MSILFSDIYVKAISLFDDPKVTIAYQTNKIQFSKIMYSYLQNAIALFTNPVSIGAKLAKYNEPEGLLQIIVSDGINNTYELDENFILRDENCLYHFTEGEIEVNGSFDIENHTVTFPDVIPEGQEYSFEQYYCGEFTEELSRFNANSLKGDGLFVNEVKDILARLLVKAWAENERNLLLDIRNLMQDSDFKITGNDKILNSKNKWVDQLDTEVLQLQNKLAWNIRFMGGSQNIGRG